MLRELRKLLVLFTLVVQFGHCFPLEGLFSGQFLSSVGFTSSGNQKQHTNDEFSDITPIFTHRDLKIGELNFLHTTDTHGWLGSHLNQDIYDGDWGDYVNFQKNLKNKILNLPESQSSEMHGCGDLLLIDTGDKHDGNGISDATVPNGIESTMIFNKQDFDLLTLGNHELYTEENSVLEYYQTATNPKFHNKYISSNVEFILEDGITKVPFGSKFTYFQTEQQKINILALSFLFDFKRFNKRALVTPIEQEIEKKWFREMLDSYPESKVDVLVVFGHLPITDHENREINNLHGFLRAHYPNIVIQYFGGHSHIRDFVEFDEKSTGLQSGRFCETVGFVSIDGVKQGAPSFHRRYIDFNKESFAYHTNGSIVATSQDLSNRIKRLRDSLGLNTVYGYIPDNYYMYNKPINSPHNIFNLLSTQVLKTLETPTGRNSVKKFIMINTGSIRFDLYKGNFTLDTEYTVSPFANTWNYITIPYWIAEQIETILNNGVQIMDRKDLVRNPSYKEFNVFDKKSPITQCPYVKNPTNLKGYITLDDYGCDGEDTVHNTMGVYPNPIVIQYQEESSDADEMVDFIYYDFIQPHVLNAINRLSSKIYSGKDCQVYGGSPTKTLLRNYFANFQE